MTDQQIEDFKSEAIQSPEQNVPANRPIQGINSEIQYIGDGEANDLEMMKRLSRKNTQSLVYPSSPNTLGTGSKVDNQRTSSFNRLNILEDELDPSKLLMVKQVSDAQRVKQKQLIKNFMLQEERKYLEDEEEENYVTDNGEQNFNAQKKSKAKTMVDLENQKLFNEDEPLLNKAQSNEMNLADKMIKFELSQMGFNRLMIDELLKNERVEDTNQAVDFLIKGPQGWTHKYVKTREQDQCAICGEEQKEHANERPRLEDLEQQVQQMQQILRSLNLDLIVANNQPLLANKSFHAERNRVDPVDIGGTLCAICYMNYNESDMHGLKCGHKFCDNCITDYLEYNITNGQVRAIKCADAACPTEYSQDDIRQFGSKEIYEKYLKFKENIDVNLNPDLKWCPRPNCNHFVRKGKKKKVICECGFDICFECGLQWHGRTKCQDAMDQDFKGWAAVHGNISNCPRCKIRLEKISGCNHMTCRQCGYQWCWLCGQKYNSFHYNPINVFGCPGQQYFTYHRFWVILLNIGIFLAVPLILLFTPPIYFLIKYFNSEYDYDCFSSLCCFMKCVRNTCDNCWCYLLMIIFTLPIVIAIGFVCGAIALVLLIIPAYLFQLYRILKLIFYRCWCCLK